MQVLNLIRPEKSSVKYKVIQFPDGEPHIALKNIDRKDNLSVICRICNPTDLFIITRKFISLIHIGIGNRKFYPTM